MLTVKDKMTLDFEAGRWWRHTGAKEQQVRHLFGESLTRYYQRLNGLLDQPAALAYAPVDVRRLQRLRDDRAQQRSTRRLL